MKFFFILSSVLFKYSQLKTNKLLLFNILKYNKIHATPIKCYCGHILKPLLKQLSSKETEKMLGSFFVNRSTKKQNPWQTQHLLSYKTSKIVI